MDEIRNQTYFFTYGTSGQPFSGGWTKVLAPNRELACAMFRTLHPDRTPGLLNCSTVYTEEEFKRTIMYENMNNLGAACRETLELVHTVHDARP